MDFVTTRKPRRARSIPDLSNIEVGQSIRNSTMLNLTALSEPGLSTIELSVVGDLKLELKEAQTALDSAHNEISVLNLENSSLKREIEQKDKKIQLLEKITIDTSTWNTPSRKQLSTPLAKKF